MSDKCPRCGVLMLHQEDLIQLGLSDVITNNIKALQSENDKLKELCEMMAKALKTCKNNVNDAWYSVDLVEESLATYKAFKKAK